MTEKKHVRMLVPSNVQRDEVILVADVFRQSLLENRIDDFEQAVKIVEPRIDGAMTGVEALLLILIVVPSKWLTQKWVDDYFWPMIKKKIDNPSQALIKWISALLDKCLGE